MDLVINGLWTTSIVPAKYSSSLRLINSLQNKVKLAPRKILNNICNHPVVSYALETSPAQIISSVLEPITNTKPESYIASLSEKVPVFESVWKTLQVPPVEWYNYFFNSLKPHPNEDIGLTTVDMIKRNGYPVEVYQNIQTDDGYLLELYRIPHGRCNKTEGPRPVVFLVHGFVTSSADYIVAGPGKGLAYMLADMGYDVWLGNPRGSRYSRKHVVYNPDSDKDFWNFSFHEIGIYDLPAMIDHVLKISEQDTLTYIGMSQGTAVFFTLMSEKPEYNDKVNLMVALAPVTFLSNAFGLLNKLGSVMHHFLDHARDFLGPREFPDASMQSTLSALYNKVQSKGFLQDVVVRFLFTLFGPNHHQLDKDVLPVLLSTLPHNSSLNQLLHFGQIAIAERFQKFDYGPKKNMEKYGSIQPPEYDLGKVKTPVAMFYSNGDLLSHSKDVLNLSKSLPSCVHVHEIEDQNFNHMDYVLAIDIVPLLNHHVINMVNKYNLPEAESTQKHTIERVTDCSDNV